MQLCAGQLIVLRVLELENGHYFLLHELISRASSIKQKVTHERKKSRKHIKRLPYSHKRSNENESVGNIGCWSRDIAHPLTQRASDASMMRR